MQVISRLVGHVRRKLLNLGGGVSVSKVAGFDTRNPL